MYDVIVIGSGPAGYVAAIKSAQMGFKTACVEKDTTLGGTCLNVGCIPSKALLHATELLYHVQKEGNILGISAPAKFSLNLLMEQKEKIVQKLTGGIAYLFKKNGVDHIHGTAAIKNKSTLEVDGKVLNAKYIIIATGTSTRHLVTLRDKIVSHLKSNKHKFLGSEGEETANWIVVDCESVVIHLFRQEVRDYYKLEDIWNKKLRTSNENSIKED